MIDVPGGRPGVEDPARAPSRLPAHPDSGPQALWLVRGSDPTTIERRRCDYATIPPNS